MVGNLSTAASSTMLPNDAVQMTLHDTIYFDVRQIIILFGQFAK